MVSVHIFDAYGTLFDVHSAVRKYAAAIGPKADAVSALWRSKQLEYSWVYGLMDARSDFWSMTKAALDFAFTAQQIDDEALKTRLLEAYWALEAYEEVTSFLTDLRQSGAKTGILSNGSPDMLQAAIQSAGLGALLDVALSVQAAGTFKTHASTYRLVLDHFSASANEVRFYSSNRWDIAGATKFGFQTIWVNRTNQPDEYLDFAPHKTIFSLIHSV